MLTIAVTGGIGAGKSTVSRLLAELGAKVVDSDQLARDVVAPGTDGLAAIRAEFGDAVIAPDGSLDRARLAAEVFAPGAGALRRAALEAIIHPRVRAEYRRLAATYAAADPHVVVVNDIPLVRTAQEAAEFDLVVVVHVTLPIRIERLIRRGLTEEDARARIAAQPTDEERAALADVVISNDGTPAETARLVRDFWATTVEPARRVPRRT